MSQTNYDVQHTFIKFGEESDEETTVPRKRSNTWDGSMSWGSFSDHEQAENVPASVSSACDDVCSDATCGNASKETTDSESTPQLAAKEPPYILHSDSFPCGPVGLQNEWSPQTGMTLQGMLPFDQFNNGTCAPAQQNNQPTYVMLPPITVRLSADGSPMWDSATKSQAQQPSMNANAATFTPANSENSAMSPMDPNTYYMMAGAPWPSNTGWMEETAPQCAAKANVRSAPVATKSNQQWRGSAQPQVFESTGRADSDSWAKDGEVERTTVMLRNLPNDYTRDMLLELLDSAGFCGLYDFVYLPVDFKRWAGFGYAFVNFVSNADAQAATTHFHGFKDWVVGSVKVCEVCWGEPLQGLAAHLDRYRNSPLMHELVPDNVRPVLFRSGQRIPFPAATKRIRHPRTKQNPVRGPRHHCVN